MKWIQKSLNFLSLSRFRPSLRHHAAKQLLKMRSDRNEGGMGYWVSSHVCRRSHFMNICLGMVYSALLVCVPLAVSLSLSLSLYGAKMLLHCVWGKRAFVQDYVWFAGFRCTLQETWFVLLLELVVEDLISAERAREREQDATKRWLVFCAVPCATP